MRVLLLHWPHILPIAVAAATVVYLWRADRRYRADQRSRTGASSQPAAATGAAEIAPARSVPLAPARAAARPVEREAARRGAIVLGPLLGAIATGAVIYGIDLDGRRAGDGLIWTHAGLSALVCLLAVYKLAGTGPAGTRRTWSLDRAIAAGGSLLLALLLVPILLTGILVLALPSDASFAANLHLIASAWWTLLVLWHLARFFGRSLRTLRRAEPMRAVHTPFTSEGIGRLSILPTLRRAPAGVRRRQRSTAASASAHDSTPALQEG